MSSPLSKSMTCVESMMVCSRWAIVSTVASAKTSRMARCRMASVSLSIDAVASSSTTTREWRSMARARQMSCRWPTEKFPPPSPTGWRSPCSSAAMTSVSCAASMACASSTSVYCSKGSRLYRSDSLKSTGSCGMMASRERKSSRLSSLMSTPSMSSAPRPTPSTPRVGSTSRQSAETKVVFPEPVRPTTPTFARGSMTHETPLRAHGSSTR
mmetsp:Transcript_52475/g.135946  ORF Transcript_52475/g.135946 Transcript_52475/m.135946 type:complete len:212 (+) Transcript_52475:578-1213(+)